MVRNPFQHIYVGEKVAPAEFVDIFSTELVQYATPLFEAGHVVLSGIQGSGKSMLFKLLQPEVRIAYSEASRSFPIPDESSRFIGAGVNVNTSRCNEFGNRRTAAGENSQELMFADFFNYLVVADIIKSIATIASHDAVSLSLGVKLDAARKAAFVEAVRNDDVWEGYMESVISFEQFLLRLKERHTAYRRYMNGNDPALRPEVASTKTSAGEPMKAVVRHLRAAAIVPADVEFLLVVDQYEELATITAADGRKADYRSVVNKVLNSRDPTVSYRIGTRGYAWRNHLNVFGTDARLEQDRDFKLVELDLKLRRQEDASTSIFPTFANDVLQRRLRYVFGVDRTKLKAGSVSDVFGVSQPPGDVAKQLAGGNPAAILKIDETWPEQTRHYLTELVKSDPLSAKLGEAWLRQKGLFDFDPNDGLPWEQKSKQYWRKERIELALLQIAGSRKQRAILGGGEDLVGLSGGNILVFLSICQAIWDLATQASDRPNREPDLPVRHSIQTVGIFQAGRTWLDRIPSDYGRSDDRFRFVQKLGETFSTSLLNDRRMSNPGHSGFSASIEELRQDPEVFSFLIECCDYGNLLMTEHATRNKDRKRRLKFYLNPIYCPVYRIPYQRVKEPLYIDLQDLRSWLAEAGIIERLEPRPSKRASREPVSAPLFDRLEGGIE